MKPNPFPTRDHYILGFLLIIAAGIRFYGLGVQSFWLDELHTAIEAPASWHDLFYYLRTVDQHPPLFFLIERLLFGLFGETEWVARAFPAVTGVVSVWVMYLLGKALYNARLGLIAAALTCFNYFHIYYSQEARPYALLFLFACLSFLYLVRLVRVFSWKNSLLYGLFTTAMLYTHYFGLFAWMSQMVIFSIFLLWDVTAFKQYLKYVGIPMALTFLLYLPWIPYLLSMSAIKKFWIAPVSASFAIDFFHAFFGDANLLKPFLYLFLLIAFMLIARRSRFERLFYKDNVYTLGLVICCTWIFITYLIPYVRSVLVVPMLFPRYAIVVLPAFLLLLAIGIDGIPGNAGKVILLCLFCCLSFGDLVVRQQYYSGIHKTQFRELAGFITSDKGYPLLTDATAWHQQYYLRKVGFERPIVGGNLDHQLDSILRTQPEGFWISGAHGSQRPDSALLQRVSAVYFIARQQQFYDAWAQLYVSRSTTRNATTLDDHAFPGAAPFNLNGDSVVPIWDNSVHSDTVTLKAGTVYISPQMYGTPVAGVYPHIQVLVNGRVIGSFYISGSAADHPLSFHNAAPLRAAIRIVMDNDATNPAAKEDRNAFIRSIAIY